jgi:hypothetical protein
MNDANNNAALPKGKTKRQAVSKKTRFEVFKRDGFQCQYCGAVPQKVVLEVDHIHPVALGGGNSADNLITSCFDCNRGKSGGKLGSALPPLGMKEKAQRLVEAEAQVSAYREAIIAKQDRIEADCWAVVEVLCDADSFRRDWFFSIKKFVEELPFEDVLYAAETAYYRKLPSLSQTFKYFCKICWRIKESLESDGGAG